MSRPPHPRGRRTALAASALLLVSLAAPESDVEPVLETPRPSVPIESERVLDLSTYSCAECHDEVAGEWAESAHGLAWIDEEYQDSLKDRRRPQSCYGCHIPEPLLVEPSLDRRPRARDDEAGHALGISCEACHTGPNGEMLGPRGTPTDAHPSASSAFMSAPESNRLCAACHSTNVGPVIGLGDDFFDAGLDERGLSCVGCHMAPVERRWADGDDVVPRLGRSHALQTPRDPGFLRKGFEVGWVEGAVGRRVRIRNLAGHRVPGLIGRSFVFEVQALDADGRALGEPRRTVVDTETYLPVDATREVDLGIEAVRARITGHHHQPRTDESALFLEETLEAR